MSGCWNNNRRNKRVMTMDILKESEKKMKSALDHLNQELRGLRTGRANPSMLDTVSAEVYGTKMRLHDVASISVPEPRQLLISPFDAANVQAIAKGIKASNLNLQPSVEGNVIRVKVPEMSQSVRDEMVKQAHRKGEDAKISIRNARREGNDFVKKQKSDGEIPEDLMKKMEKKIQELTDKFCKEVDHLIESKEKEIVSI